LYDVIVVGAGPAGCRTAELIAKKGYKVLVLTQHEEIGKPVKCSGLVSWRLKELVPNLPENVIVNEVESAKFFSSSGSCLELKSKKPVYVIDREMLDKYLAERAKQAGVEIKLSTKFEKIKFLENGVEVKTNKGNFETKLLVGADGVNSIVARQINLKQPENILTGIQATVEGNFDSHSVELWFGKNICPNFFAWVVPENENTARIGLATSANAKSYFDKFLRKRIGKTKKPDVAGRIIFGLMENTVADRILLVGDAASQVKPFSGGGIIYGLIGAGFASLACIKSLEKENYSCQFLKENYDEKWKQKLAKPIERGLLLSKAVHQHERLFDLSIKLGRIVKPLMEEMDMDFLGND